MDTSIALGIRSLSCESGFKWYYTDTLNWNILESVFDSLHGDYMKGALSKRFAKLRWFI